MDPEKEREKHLMAASIYLSVGLVFFGITVMIWGFLLGLWGR